MRRWLSCEPVALHRWCYIGAIVAWVFGSLPRLPGSRFCLMWRQDTPCLSAIWHMVASGSHDHPRISHRGPLLVALRRVHFHRRVLVYPSLGVVYVVSLYCGGGMVSACEPFCATVALVLQVGSGFYVDSGCARGGDGNLESMASEAKPSTRPGRPRPLVLGHCFPTCSDFPQYC